MKATREPGECKVMFCGCTHKYQDEKYGHQMRMHNAGKGMGNSYTYKCTVCGTKKI